ncbi:hypothetical protein [Nonomuraea sp. NPDC002799]
MTLPDEQDSEDGLIIEPEFGGAEDVPMFSDDQYAAVESLLARADGIRLSALLKETRRPGSCNIDQLLALQVLGLFGAPRHDAERRTTLTALADDEVFAGNDLLVVRGPIVNGLEGEA